MSSLLRRLERKRKRVAGTFEVQARPHREHATTQGYDVLHPTKGWQRFSERRLTGIANIMQLNADIDRRMGRS